MVQLPWKTVSSLLEKLKIIHDPAIPILGMYPKALKAGSQRCICTSVFSAALLTVAKRWRQAKVPSMGGWINQRQNMYPMEYSTSKKKF